MTYQNQNQLTGQVSQDQSKNFSQEVKQELAKLYVCLSVVYDIEKAIGDINDYKYQGWCSMLHPYVTYFPEAIEEIQNGRFTLPNNQYYPKVTDILTLLRRLKRSRESQEAQKEYLQRNTRPMPENVRETIEDVKRRVKSGESIVDFEPKAYAPDKVYAAWQSYLNRKYGYRK